LIFKFEVEFYQTEQTSSQYRSVIPNVTLWLWRHVTLWLWRHVPFWLWRHVSYGLINLRRISYVCIVGNQKECKYSDINIFTGFYLE